MTQYIFKYLLLIFCLNWSVVNATELPTSITVQLEKDGYLLDAFSEYQDFHVITAHHRSQEKAFYPIGTWLFIFKADQLVLKKAAPRDDDLEHRSIGISQVGLDVTGHGKSNVVLELWSGGAHCCYTLQVYELSEHPHLVASVFKKHSDAPALFHPPKNGGVPVLQIYDWIFSYMFGSFSDTPAQAVLLRFNGQRFALATDLMRWDKDVQAPAIWRVDPVLACQIGCPITGVEAEWQKQITAANADSDSEDFLIDNSLLCRIYCADSENKTALLSEWQQQREKYIVYLQECLKQNHDIYAKLADAVNPLVYGGDIDGAKALVTKVFANKKAEKAFWRDYAAILSGRRYQETGKSLYWSDLKTAYPAIQSLAK